MLSKIFSTNRIVESSIWLPRKMMVSERIRTEMSKKAIHGFFLLRKKKKTQELKRTASYWMTEERFDWKWMLETDEKKAKIVNMHQRKQNWSHMRINYLSESSISSHIPTISLPVLLCLSLRLSLNSANGDFDGLKIWIVPGPKEFDSRGNGQFVPTILFDIWYIQFYFTQ